MRPTEHMDPSGEELFAHIREQLSAHEEEYLPGAWERFSQEEKKKGFLWLWPLSTAAILILCASLFLWPRSQELATEPVNPAISHKSAEQAALPVPPSGNMEQTAETQDHLAVVGQRKMVSGRQVLSVKATAGMPPGLIPVEVVAATVKGLPGSTTRKEAVEAEIIKPEDSKPLALQQKSTIEAFLEQESRMNASNNKPKAVKQADKWELGVMVAPSVGNSKKVNMGYGVSMSYSLSDKVSLSSGIAYNEMGASAEPSVNEMRYDLPVATALANDSRSLQSVETKLVGLDVPLELRYRISSKIYANAGISVFAVLRQDQQNTFLQSNVETAPNSFAASDEKSFQQVMQTRMVSEAAPVEELEKDKYLGFYNFSIGFRQKVSKKNSVALEPFMRLPMKEVSKENLRLIGTGLKVRFDF